MGSREMKVIYQRQDLLLQVARQPLVIVICYVKLDPYYEELAVNFPKVKFLKCSYQHCRNVLNNENLGRYPEFVFFVHGNEQRHLQKSLIDVPAHISVSEFISNMIKENYRGSPPPATKTTAPPQPVPNNFNVVPVAKSVQQRNGGTRQIYMTFGQQQRTTTYDRPANQPKRRGG